MGMTLRTEPQNEYEEYLLERVRRGVELEHEVAASNEAKGFGRMRVCSVEEFVLTNGGFWGPRREDVPCRGIAQQCYGNAQRYARRHKGVWYVEGLAVSVDDEDDFVLRHAWCVEDGGAVIDVTPQWCKGVNYAYFGVVLPMELVDEQIEGNTESVCVLDNWEKEYPLLKLVDGKPRRIECPFA